MSSPDLSPTVFQSVRAGIRIACVVALASLLLACGGDTSPKEITKTREVVQPGGLRWAAPPGWKKGPEQNMRVVTFVPEAHPKTQCYITVLSGRAGGVDANVNRWRDQLGQPALSPEQITALEKIQVLGTASTLVEITSAPGAGGESMAMLGLICSKSGSLLTVKMVGPAASVKAERENFLRFCKSLRG